MKPFQNSSRLNMERDHDISHLAVRDNHPQAGVLTLLHAWLVTPTPQNNQALLRHRDVRSSSANKMPIVGLAGQAITLGFQRAHF